MITLLVNAAVLVGGLELAPTYSEARKLFEAGKYREAIQAAESVEAEGALRSRLIYLQALSHQKLNEIGEANELYSRLAEGAENDAWTAVGQAGQRLNEKQIDEGVAAASRAVAADPSLAEAHYQLGLAYGFKNEFAKAAAEFERAAQLDPAFAYAHYYAGLSFNRVKRIDRMAEHFQMFLKLAPEAPERGEIDSIMRTVRGR